MSLKILSYRKLKLVDKDLLKGIEVVLLVHAKKADDSAKTVESLLIYPSRKKINRRKFTQYFPIIGSR